MSDETEAGERHAEQVAEDHWIAEYVGPYRGVAYPANWQNYRGSARDGWRQGVDAALELHADVIKKCNAALQQVTGGSRPDGMIAAGALREVEHEITNLADLIVRCQARGTHPAHILVHALHRLDELAGVPFPRGAAVLESPALPLPTTRVMSAHQPGIVLEDNTIHPPIRVATVLPDMAETLGLATAYVAVNWDHDVPNRVSVHLRAELLVVTESEGHITIHHGQHP